MRRNQLTKRLLAMLMALVMAMGLAIPGLAAGGIGLQRPGTTALNTGGTLPGYVPMTLDNGGNGIAAISKDDDGNPTPPYRITIYPGNYTAQPTGNTEDSTTPLATRFHAYQIFSGSLSKDSDGNYKGTIVGDDIWQGAPGILSDVKWGVSVSANIPGVLDALTSETLTNPAQTKASSVGITKDMIEASLARYEDAYTGTNLNNLKGYSKENWDDAGGGATNFKIGEKIYATYDEAREAARKADLEDKFSSLTLADLFRAALKYAGYEKVGGNWQESNLTTTTLAGTAKVVSQVLADFTDTNNLKLAETFAKILYKSNALGSAETNSKWTGTEWTIGENVLAEGTAASNSPLRGGYYLIVDQYYDANDSDKSESDFMLGVYGDVSMTAKSDAPMVEKYIVDNDFDPLKDSIITETPEGGNASVANARKGDDFEMGEEITFLLTGTLPQNFANYDGFFYAFNDTMHPGLTYVKDSVRVYVKVENPLYDQDRTTAADPNYVKVQYLDLDITELLANSYANNDTKHYFIYVGSETNGETTLRIVFNDLQDISFADFEDQIKKQIAKNDGDSAYEEKITEILGTLKLGYIKDKTEVTVTYKAYLDTDAVLNTADALLGNKNRVYLTYSNSVTQPTERDGYIIDKGTGLRHTADTTLDIVYPYTFGIDLLKYDGTKTVNDVLEAGFTLSKEMTATEYALCDGPDGSIVMWISEAELLNYLGLSAAPDTWDYYAGKTLGTIAEGAGISPGNFAKYNLKFTDTEAGASVIRTAGESYYAIAQDTGLNLIAAETVTPITRMGKETYYAIVAKDTVASNTNKYFLAGWILEDELVEFLHEDAVSPDDVTEAEWKKELLHSSIENYLYPGFTPADVYSTILMTTIDGHLWIDGLDMDSTYVLTERIIPEGGFEPLEGPIKIDFKAEYYLVSDTPNAGKLKTLTATVTYNGADNALGFGAGVNSKEIHIVKDGRYVNVDGGDTSPVANDLRVHLSVANYPEGYLPGTGGIGTYLFYIGGGALLAGAVLLLILTNSKSGKKAEKRGQQ